MRAGRPVQLRGSSGATQPHAVETGALSEAVLVLPVQASVSLLACCSLFRLCKQVSSLPPPSKAAAMSFTAAVQRDSHILGVCIGAQERSYLLREGQLDVLLDDPAGGLKVLLAAVQCR